MVIGLSIKINFEEAFVEARETSLINVILSSLWRLHPHMTSEGVWRLPWPPKATKIVVIGNMHMDTRVINGADFNNEVKLDQF